MWFLALTLEPSFLVKGADSLSNRALQCGDSRLLPSPRVWGLAVFTWRSDRDAERIDADRELPSDTPLRPPNMECRTPLFPERFRANCSFDL